MRNDGTLFMKVNLKYNFISKENVVVYEGFFYPVQ